MYKFSIFDRPKSTNLEKKAAKYNLEKCFMRHKIGRRLLTRVFLLMKCSYVMGERGEEKKKKRAVLYCFFSLSFLFFTTSPTCCTLCSALYIKKANKKRHRPEEERKKKKLQTMIEQIFAIFMRDD